MESGGSGHGTSMGHLPKLRLGLALTLGLAGCGNSGTDDGGKPSTGGTGAGGSGGSGLVVAGSGGSGGSAGSGVAGSGGAGGAACPTGAVACRGACLVAPGDQANGCRLLYKTTLIWGMVEHQGALYISELEPMGEGRITRLDLATLAAQELIDPADGRPGPLVADGDTLYFVVHGEGDTVREGLHSMPLTGGPSTPLVTGLYAIQPLEVASGNLYYLHDNVQLTNLAAVPTSGGPAVESGFYDVSFADVSGNDVVFFGTAAEFEGQRLFRAPAAFPIDPSSATLLLPTSGTFLSADASYAYYMSNTMYRRVPLLGGTDELVLDLGERVFGYRVLDEIFWPKQPELFSMPQAGGALTPLGAVGYFDALDATATHIYIGGNVIVEVTR